MSFPNSENQIHIEKWNVCENNAQELLSNSVMAIVGSGQSGKTFFLKKLAQLCDVQVLPLEDFVNNGSDSDENVPLCFISSENVNDFEKIVKSKSNQNLLVIECQWWLNIQPEIRREIDYVVLTGRQDNKTMERIWSQYQHLFQSTLDFKSFAQIIDDYTRDWMRVVIDVSLKTRQGLRPAKVFWYA